MGDPQTVNMVAEDGSVTAVSADAVAAALAQGYRVEGDRERVARLVQEQRTEDLSGIGNTLAAGIQSGANALSLGGYGAIVGAAGGGDLYNQLQEAHPDAALAGNIIGTVAPAVATLGGSLLARGGATAVGELAGGAARLLEATPAGLTMRLGSRIAESGGASVLGRTAARVGAGAVEGGIYGAGGYISDVALGNRELSADGFIGAMGEGALYGGAAGGALSVGSEALTAARRLFPKQEVTRAAVQKAQTEAVAAVREAADDSKQLVDAARAKLRSRREVLSMDPAIKQQLDEIAVQRARDVAEAEVSAARAKASEAGSKAEAAAARAERAKAPPRRTRKAMGGAEPAPSPIPAPAQVAEEAATDAATLLQRQLMGTKAGLDAGETLTELAARRPTAIGLKPTAVEDALNAHIAKVDPEAAKLVKGIAEIEDSQTALSTWLDKYGKGGAVGRMERSEAARATADSWRSKKPGWYSSVPEGEGTPGLARGRQWEFRGSEAERAAAEDAFYARQGGRERLESDVVRVYPDEIVGGGPRELHTIDDRVKEALGSKVDDIGEDINDTAAAIGRMEKSSADLADALEDSAPLRSKERAAALRDAERQAQTSGTEAAARAAGDAEQAAATIGLTGELPAAASKGGVIDSALRAGDVIEALNMLGIPVPDLGKIPVVGPVLKAVLQARVVRKAFGRFGGRVAETAETVIASKAARTRERVNAAVDAILSATSKGMAKSVPAASAVSAALGHTLFDDRKPDEKRTPAPAGKTDQETLYLARMDELAKAMQPGAIAQSVRDRVRASDPAIVDLIVKAQERKLQYLYDKAPKPDSPLGLLENGRWTPAPAEIRTWARILGAAENPAGVLERVAGGQVVAPDEIEAVKSIYPTLYDEARTRLVTKAAEAGSKMPYARRVQLSLLFDAPLDGTMRPEYAHFLQQDYQAKPPAPAPQGPAPQPTIAADVNIGQATDPYTR